MAGIHKQRKSSNYPELIDQITSRRMRLSCNKPIQQAHVDMATIGDIDNQCWAIQRFIRRQAATNKLQLQATRREMMREALYRDGGES